MFHPDAIGSVSPDAFLGINYQIRSFVGKQRSILEVNVTPIMIENGVYFDELPTIVTIESANSTGTHTYS